MLSKRYESTVKLGYMCPHFKMFEQMLQKHFKKCFIHMILYGSKYIINSKRDFY